MTITALLAIALYIGCAIILVRRLFSDNPKRAGLPVFILATVALLFHAADILQSIKAAGGWNLSLFSALSISSWLMACIALLIGIKTIAHPGILIYPLTALSLLLKSIFPSEHSLITDNPALEWHILLSLSAYSVLALAAIQAGMLARQEKRLHNHQKSRVSAQLDPLQTMENTLFQFITVGFVLLTLSLVSGAIFVQDFWGQNLGHKTIFSLIAWVVFSVLLWGRWQQGWRGQTAVRWCLIGFSLLLPSYVGSKLVLEFFLK